MGIVHAGKTNKEELGLMMTGSLDLTEEKKDKNYGIAKDSTLTEARIDDSVRRILALKAQIRE